MLGQVRQNGLILMFGCSLNFTAISAGFLLSSPIHPAVSVTSATTTTAATPHATLTVPTTVHMTAVAAELNTTSATLTTVPTITVPSSLLIPTSDTVPTATQTTPGPSAIPGPSMTTTSTMGPMLADTSTEISAAIPVKTATTKNSPDTSRTPLDRPGKHI